MIISEQWLREWIDLNLDTGELVDRLTMAGLEVAAVTRAGPELADVVVGRIQQAGPHPNADKLKVCRVDVGRRTPLDIVCGAANARTGMNVAAALPGATLPGGMAIGQSEIRGVTSQGMLCSAAELGLEDHSEGILELDGDARVGRLVAEALAFDDPLLDIELTPNRGDCLSILGVARELAVLTGAPLKRQDVPGVEAAINTRPQVELLAGAGCPRYTGRRVEGLDTAARTPSWMAERLRRCGLRPLSPVVDVTNYVMLELGQPMHAFDAERIERGIRVRYASEGETLALLDGSTVTLTPDTLIIADHGKPIGLAGIMGGDDSAISGDTTAIVFEAAHFRPQTIAGRARAFGMQTDSSFRFERGVDPMMPEAASHYATHLITRIAGGRAGPLVDRRLRRYLPRRPAIRVWHQQVNRLLGTEVPRREARRIFDRIGSPAAETAGGWRVTPPSYRFDLERECDLIEELARVRGYDTIPANQPHMPATARVGSESDVPVSRIKQVMTERGYREAVTYSFVDGDAQERLMPGAGGLALANPLSDKMAVMRNSLWTGLLQAAMGNLNRQHPRVRLFEAGKVFRMNGTAMHEVPVIGGVVTGPVHPVQWGIETRKVDFFDLKSDVEALLSMSGDSDVFRFRRGGHEALHPGQSAAVERDGDTVGWLGRMHPALQSEFDIDAPVYLFELELAAIRHRRLPVYRGVSRFPAIRRDLSLTVDGDQPVADLTGAVREVAGDMLAEMEIFDLYHPPGETSRGKSVGIGLTLRNSSRTLKDQEVETVIKKILDVLKDRFGANLRT
ncbi:MAG: phenylalanine--tRNA ligase subunit beta [Gammaproteobacteria bacterium]|nr:phenylalanine--tRNA ligase subunit beta [Gammaproteobacteria bacterium]